MTAHSVPAARPARFAPSAMILAVSLQPAVGVIAAIRAAGPGTAGGAGGHDAGVDTMIAALPARD